MIFQTNNRSRIAFGFLMTLLSSLLVGGVVAADEKSPKPTPIRVVIIDGQNNHNWPVTTPQLKRALEAAGGRFKVAVSTSTKTDNKKADPSITPVAFPPDLTAYDVVLSNYNGAPWPEEFQKALASRLAEGAIGLVIVHAANNSFPEWKEYNRMIGMGWRNNKFGDRLVVDADGKEQRVAVGRGPGASHGKQHPFQIVVRDPDHPITKGMPKEWLHTQDELYHGMRGPAENVHLLATAYSDQKNGGTGEHEPMIWTVTYGKGRVFHTPMGHAIEALRCRGFIATLQRGTEWAATGTVTLPIPADFPKPDAVSTEPAK